MPILRALIRRRWLQLPAKMHRLSREVEYPPFPLRPLQSFRLLVTLPLSRTITCTYSSKKKETANSDLRLHRLVVRLQLVHVRRGGRPPDAQPFGVVGLGDHVEVDLLGRGGSCLEQIRYRRDDRLIVFVHVKRIEKGCRRKEEEWRRMLR